MKKFNGTKSAPGLERVILKKLPKYLFAGTIIPALMSLLVRLLPSALNAEALAKHQTTIDILAISIAITAWTAIFTIAIGYIIVIIMKGRTYTADSYKLQDSERPRDKNER